MSWSLHTVFRTHFQATSATLTQQQVRDPTPRLDELIVIRSLTAAGTQSIGFAHCRVLRSPPNRSWFARLGSLGLRLSASPNQGGTSPGFFWSRRNARILISS